MTAVYTYRRAGDLSRSWPRNAACSMSQRVESSRIALRIAALTGIVFFSSATGCSKMNEHSDVRYDDRFDDDEMDIYVPEEDGTYPAVMFIHGGAWISGSRSEFTEAAKRLARSGYVTANIEYRFVPDIVYPENVRDCTC